MTPPDLAQLHARLDALGTALDGDGDVDAAAEQMTVYHDELQAYIAGAGAQAPVEALRGLLQLQNALLLRMHGRKHTIGEALRRARRSESAARAYAEEAL